MQGNFAFFYDLEKNAPCLYEPNLYLISVPEFIIKMVIGIPQVIEVTSCSYGSYRRENDFRIL